MWFFFFLPRFISEVVKLERNSMSRLATQLIFPITSGELGVVDIESFGSNWQNPVIFPRNMRCLKTLTLPSVNQETMRKIIKLNPVVSNHALRPHGLQITLI